MKQRQGLPRPRRVFPRGIPRRPVLLAPLLAVLVGCASASTPGTDGTLADVVAARGLDPSTILVPFELTPEMRQWAREAVPEGVPKEQQVDRLLNAMLRMEGLNLEYQAGYTGTAREVFENRTANCLSFTHLFVAFARSLDLDAYFLKIDEIQTFAREGDLVIRAGHITAAAGPPTAPRILEFSQQQDFGYRQISRISDLEAVALFYSNRGAEFMRQSKTDEAVWWLERAVVLAPREPDIWVNLGVARRWQGKEDLAEASYHRALELDPATHAAYNNLAALYRKQGKEDVVADLLAMTDRRDNRNPFTYLELGDISLRQGDTESANRFYRRALRLDNELASVHAALGQLAVTSGRSREASRMFQKAFRIDPDDDRVRSLGRSLGYPMVDRDTEAQVALTADASVARMVNDRTAKKAALIQKAAANPAAGKPSAKAAKLGLGGKQELR